MKLIEHYSDMSNYSIAIKRAQRVYSTFLAFTLTLIAFTLNGITTASAMGSGDKFQDLQTGVTYRVYKPSNTLGLKQINFEVRDCKLYPKKDSYLLAGYGGMDQGIALVESSAQFNCAGVDHPRSLGSIKINGISAKIGIYCSSKCKASDFSKFGGEITFTTPKSKTLGSTFIRVGTQGGYTLKELTTFAKSLKPIIEK